MTDRLFHRRRVACVWVLCLPVCISGCGGTYDSTVSGAVTFDGNKVTRGTVAYHPVASGPAAYARIDEDGMYSVRTGREEGLPAGEYQVTVTANEPPTTQQTAAGGPPPPGKSITPLWYRAKQTSGLKFNVEPGDNTINLELTKQPPAGWSLGR
jgi:hypothetical protein